jgi:tight adherence protein C
MSTLAITITIFLAVFFGLLAVLLYFNRSVNPVVKRLERLRNEPSVDVDRGGVAAGYGGGASEQLLVVDPASFSSLRADLTHAGYRGKNSVAWFRSSSIGLAAVLGIAGYSIGSTLPLENGMVLLLAFGAAVAGYATPYLWVQNRVTRRREDIRRSVPNVLDLIIVCVEAGLGLNAAVQRIAREMRQTYPELARELNILNQEIFLGINRAEAFRNLALRTGVDELRSLATVLMQSDRLGTSVADVLRVQADNLRTKRRQMAMEIAAKMPVKLIFPLVLFIFPQLILVILGPAMIQIFRTLSEMAN